MIIIIQNDKNVTVPIEKGWWYTIDCFIHFLHPRGPHNGTAKLFLILRGSFKYSNDIISIIIPVGATE